MAQNLVNKFFKVVFFTWAFWSVIFSINFDFLWGPFFIFTAKHHYTTYHEILTLPLIVAFTVTIVFVVVLRKMRNPTLLNICAVNVIFLSTLLLSAENYKVAKVTNSARQLGYDRLVQQSFLKSVLYSGHEFQMCVHALLCKDNETWIWSYREMNFFLIPETISRNVGICYHDRITCSKDPKP